METPVKKDETKKKKTGRVKFWVSVVGVVVILFVTYALFPQPSSRVTRLESTATSGSQQQPQSGTLELNTTTWSKGVIVDGQHRITAKMVTRNIWTDYRLNGDDNFIFSLPPENWAENYHDEITNKFNLIEFKVSSLKNPGCKGTLIYVLSLQGSSPVL